MTEVEWSGDELWRMLHFAFQAWAFSARKQILFCAGVCRLRGDMMPVAYLPILDDLEAFAESPALPTLPARASPGFWDWQKVWANSITDDRFTSLQHRAREVFAHRQAQILPAGTSLMMEGDPRYEADEAILYATMVHSFACCRGDDNGHLDQSRSEADLLRDLLGNPFRPVTINDFWRCWNNGTVVQIAQASYDERVLPSGHLDRARLAILADAMEEAGCVDANTLGHLRGPGPHVRGCYVIDLLTGREGGRP